MWGNRPCGEQLPGESGSPVPTRKRLVAQRRRWERACKRAAAASVTFCEREGKERSPFRYGKGGHFGSASAAFPQKREGAFVGEPQVPTTFERSVSAAEIPPQRSASSGSRSPPNKKAPGWVPFYLAETVGFEPTCLSLDKTISSRSRYDHFDTSPSINSPQMRELSVISTPLVPGKSGEPGHFRNRRIHAGLRGIGAAG